MEAAGDRLREKLTLRLRCAEIKLKKRDLGFLGIPGKQRLDILPNVPRKALSPVGAKAEWREDKVHLG